jgi:SsrA-binding protein
MKIIHKNKKATFDYEILQTFIAGIVLTGPEIKSIRAGHVNLKGSYVSILKGEAYLKNAQITKYGHDNSADYDPFRDRKLLLKKNELHKIEQKLNTQGVTMVALVVGLKGRYAKVEIALARGKKKHDKRETIKGREMKRTMDRLKKNYG